MAVEIGRTWRMAGLNEVKTNDDGLTLSDADWVVAVTWLADNESEKEWLWLRMTGSRVTVKKNGTRVHSGKQYDSNGYVLKYNIWASIWMLSLNKSTANNHGMWKIQCDLAEIRHVYRSAKFVSFSANYFREFWRNQRVIHLSTAFSKLRSLAYKGLGWPFKFIACCIIHSVSNPPRKVNQVACSVLVVVLRLTQPSKKLCHYSLHVVAFRYAI